VADRISLIAFQIDIVNKIFVQNLESPLLYKNHPPVAGAIYWERSLFYRIKHTILRFQEVEEILDSERGQEVGLLQDPSWDPS
jgi:dynein heavy chain